MKKPLYVLPSPENMEVTALQGKNGPWERQDHGFALSVIQKKVNSQWHPSA